MASSLVTYAFGLSNFAHATVESLGSYERDRGISDADRKQKDEKLGFAVMLLCRASGIFSHIADVVLSEWDTDESSGSSRPADLTREVNSGLAK